MLSLEPKTPSLPEKEAQLATLLLSNTLREAPTLAQLLERLVRADLDGKPLDREKAEYILGIEIFGKHKDWIPLGQSTVRQGMKNLRDALDRHYGKEGQADLVVIDFPKRQGFAPVFFYNELVAALLLHKKAIRYFCQTFPNITSGTARDA